MNRRFTTLTGLISLALVVAACSGLQGVISSEVTPTEKASTLDAAKDRPQLFTTLSIESPPHTLVPQTGESNADCPVNLPNLTQSPDERYISTESGFGNPERNIFFGLWPEGKVIFSPDGPGSIEKDGSLSMKFWFYRTIPGDVTITGRRLDAPAPPMPTLILRGEEDGYGETGFQPSGLTFPTPGCWEVTASIGKDSLTFVTLVVKLDENSFHK